MEELPIDTEPRLRRRHVMEFHDEVPTQVPPEPEVDFTEFYDDSVAARIGKMLWAGLRWKPVLQTRALTFGQRIAFMGDPDQIAVVRNVGEVIRFDLTTGAHKTIFPTHDAATQGPVHCVQSQPNTVQSLGLGTKMGPVILRFAKTRSRDTEIEVMPYGRDAEDETDSMDFHPSGMQFVTAGPSNAGFMIWDYTLQCRQQITTGINRITALSYSPCGSFVAAVSDGRWLLVYCTLGWSCIRIGTRGIKASVLSFAWSHPCPGRTFLVVAFSDAASLELYEVLYREDRIVERQTSLVSTKQHLSAPQPHGVFLNVKDLCWDPYGRRLAALLDRPHPKAGHIALYMTRRTERPEFITYVCVTHDIQFAKCDPCRGTGQIACT